MPIFCEIEFSKSLMFVSFEITVLDFLILKILTKVSACLTESFFSIILVATKSAFSDQLKPLHDHGSVFEFLLVLLHFQVRLKVLDSSLYDFCFFQ